MLETVVIDFLHLFYENFHLTADVRSRDKFLMGSPTFVLAIVTFYLLITMYLLSTLKTRKERCLNPISLFFCFNAFVIIMSSYFLYKLFKYMIYSNFNIRCMPLDEGTSYETMQVRITRIEILKKRNSIFSPLR